MQSNEYPFRLEKHPKKKGECPNCGHSKVFRYYEDLAGNRLEDFGICDRANSCGEHLPPRGKAAATLSGVEVPPPPQPVQIFPEGPQLERFNKAQTRLYSNLHQYLTKLLGITKEHFQAWGMGGEVNKTVFIFRNRDGRIVNGKSMVYKADGHRNKDFEALSLKQPENPLQRYALCLYGEHLLDPEKKKTVIVVESEKTAVIASFFYPQFDWVACAANTGLTDAKIPVLFGRRVVWLCDADAAGRPGKSNSSIRKLQGYHINHQVVDPFPDRTDGYDIADHIIDQKGKDLLNLEQLIADSENPAAVPVEISVVDTAPPLIKGEGAGDGPPRGEVSDDHAPTEKPVADPVKEKPARSKKDKKATGGAADTADQSEQDSKKSRKKKEADLSDDWQGTVWYTQEGGMRIKAAKYFDEVASNFQLFIKYRTEDEQENVTWVLEIQKNDDTSEFIEVIHDDFFSARKLKNLLGARRLGFKIKDGHLDELHSYLFTKTKFNTATKVIRYGYHPESKVYFFANKALNLKDGNLLTPDEFGIVEANNFHLSIPQQTKIRQLRYTLTDQPVTFQAFWSLYATAHHRENAFLPACFYIFSLFRDIGLKFKNFSPILFLKGGAGTGKSSMVRILTAAFGRKQEGVNLKSKNTDAALIKLMSQTSNSIIWFDEYHNELTNEGLMQAAYDNDGYHKSTADFNSIDTATVDIHSALALTSNYLPENPIFFSRCVFVPITAQDKSDRQRQAFYALEDMQEGGMGTMTIELLRHRELLENNDNYGVSFNRLYNALKTRFVGQSIPERLFANMAQILAAPYTFQCFGKINLLDIVTTNEQEILDDYVSIGSDFIIRQWRIVNESKAIAAFFEFLQLLFDENKIQEEFHFRFIGESIYLNFRKLYNLFSQRYRQVFFKSPPDRDTIQSELEKGMLANSETQIEALKQIAASVGELKGSVDSVRQAVNGVEGAVHNSNQSSRMDSLIGAVSAMGGK